MDEKLTLDEVEVLLIEPDKAVRSTIRNILVDNGFRKVAVGDGMKDIEPHFKISTPDLLISDTSLPDGNFQKFVHNLRHHELGSNPFMPVIATVWSPTAQDIRGAVQSGVDIIVTKPLSAGQLLQRIKQLIKARKQFVVTSNYIGPNRRKAGEERGGFKIDPFDVPNTLKAKALGDHNTDVDELQSEIDTCTKMVNLQKLDRHGQQAMFLAKRIAPGLAFYGPDEATLNALNRLLYVAEDIYRRMSDTPYARVHELCQTLIDVTVRILKAGDFPEQKDVKLLIPLIQAINLGFSKSALGLQQASHENTPPVTPSH